MPAGRQKPDPQAGGGRLEAWGIAGIALLVMALALNQHPVLRADVVGWASRQLGISVARAPAPRIMPGMMPGVPMEEAAPAEAMPLPDERQDAAFIPFPWHEALAPPPTAMAGQAPAPAPLAIASAMMDATLSPVVPSPVVPSPVVPSPVVPSPVVPSPVVPSPVVPSPVVPSPVVPSPVVPSPVVPAPCPAPDDCTPAEAAAPPPPLSLPGTQEIRPPPVLWRPDPALREAAEQAAAVTGIRAETLLAIAAAESSLRQHARNSRSTATGPFQFTEEAWLRAIRSFGARHGLKHEAERVTADARGHLRLRDARLRRALLQRRTEVGLATMLAAESARDNAQRFERVIGRAATDDEVYAMHVLGLGRVLRLVRMAEGQDGASLSPALPAEVVRKNAELLRPAAGRADAVLSSIQGRYADRFSGVNPPSPEVIRTLNEIALLHRHLVAAGLAAPGIGNAAPVAP